MEKAKLNKIFSQAFQLNDWLDILKSVFGARQLLSQPKPILLKNNDRAKSATELGSFSTSDDRIIGLYHVVVGDDIWLERNKVGLRELLRDIYRYDVDGALVVFEQNDKWRLSFISEIKVLNDEGEVVEQATEPKRFTYLLGVDEKVKTPSERLSKIAGKALSLTDILNVFSVEALNEEFYKIISEYFYQLVGGVVGTGKSAKTYEPQLKLPSIPLENHQVYQEFVVRLIGRTIFCWFLKMKKSDNDDSLIPESLLSSSAVKNNKNYYHSVLERLFFQTLNTRMNERVENLPEGCKKIPFLNGGLFEPNSDDYFKPNKTTGLSDNLNTLVVEDEWFLKLFQELEKYNFTIDENSVTDVEVSVDPEMLGRIFENLLAEIDPDSGETARKATGSFYTPREIVDYMATESLVQYINNKTGVSNEKLRPVFKMTEEPDPTFTNEELEGILNALDKVKILDPACGSGAFPMGVLQKIVQSLQKLDADAKWWKKRQVERITNPIVRKALREKLDSSGVEYARKIGVIQNSLYGVDIQPIAAEISKLRCFLTLIVDENIDDNKENRGIEPLPNLEFKFVTADTLQKLPEQEAQKSLFDNYEEQELLKELRTEYMQSSGKKKEKIKERFKRTQQKMFKNEMHLFVDTKSRGYKLSSWNPFSHDKAEWFDSNWMFGIESFDIVIGNPPYVLLQNTSLSVEKQNELRKAYSVAQYKTDLFHLFFERGFHCLENKGGILCYITPNTYLKNKHNDQLRKLMLDNCLLRELIRFYVPIFENASVDNAITILQRQTPPSDFSINVKDVYNKKFTELNESPSVIVKQSSLMIGQYSFDFDLIGDEVLQKVSKNPPLSEYGRAYFGIQTYDRKSFVSNKKESNDFKPVVDGVHVNRYILAEPDEFVCFTSNAIKSGGNQTVYQKERILVRQIGKFPEGCYCPPEVYTLNTIYNIFLHENSVLKLKYLLALINSKVINYYWINIFSDNKKTFPKIKKTPLESIPICKVDEATQLLCINLVEIIELLLALNEKKTVNQKVTNRHLSDAISEVLDAVVMELYFKEEFNKVGLEIIRYVESYFGKINGKPEPEQFDIINRAYQKLNEKDNEIRNNLKLMDIKLADIVLPIKSVK